MNRFPRHFHEQAEKPLRCFCCDQPLTETEADHYWLSQLHGQGEPYCFDCASQLEVALMPEELGAKPSHSFSTALLLISLALLVSVALFPLGAGWSIMAAIGCGSLGLMARICGW